MDTWLRPCRLVAVEGDHLRIGAPNKFHRDWLFQHHLDTLHTAARESLGGQPRVSIVVDENPSPTPAQPPAPHAVPTGGRVEGLNPRYTFDSFVVGSSNQFAQAASQAVAELPSKAYNPLFIYGGVGLGKTHLLHAVGHQTSRLFPAMAVAYLSSERFTNELINAIRYDRTAEFRARYRNIDLLLIDDIQFISGKERTQEEFFHTFNDLYESRKQIIVSSDCSPKDIPEIEERLRSRFEWGLIADIQPPDFETRVAILRKKAALERVLLDDDVAFLIAGRIKSNIRELEGSLTRMIAFCALTGREMSVELAQEVLADLWGEEEKVITIDQVQRKVSDFFGVKVSDLKAKNRTKAVAFPRQVAMYLARQLTHASLAEVGRAFGGKDHTTVLHAVDKIQTLLQEDPKLKKTIEGLIQGVQL
ncbi:MAG: chromosomal replication initiation protein DnaA [Candidatus Rokubacteria bacterium 13_1_40CM_68_15]|nr:MAG: chromosomal replication initiation protein DnaA [Candidatus Rokubacteria bacterium 13_1_40CM_68_15]